MKPSCTITLSLLLSGGVLLASHASAQTLTLITGWNFDQLTAATVNTSPAPSTGSGTAASLGMTTPTGTSPGDSSDITADTDMPASSDPTAGSNAFRIRGGDGTEANTTTPATNGWTSAAPIGSQGAQFLVSTAGFNGVQVSFDWEATKRGEQNLQLQYTLDGMTFQNVPTTLFTSTGGLTALTNGTNANLVMGGYLQVPTTTAGNTGFFDKITATLSTIPGANNDPTFGIRLVSAATGPADTDTTGTALNNTSGNWRFDEVNISGTSVSSTPAPEPSTYAMLLLGALGLGWMVRRARSARA